MPPVIFLLRHAESATPHIFHGAESDVELGANGHTQAAAAAEWFQSQNLTAVVSSEQLRARQTAAAIAQLCDVPHTLEFGLHERIVGDLLGTTFKSDHGPWHDTIQAWMRGETTYTTARAESYDEVRDRAKIAFQSVVSAHRQGRVAVVSHGITIKILLLTLLNWHPSRWHEVGKVANTAVSELHPAGEFWQAARLLEVPWSVPTAGSSA
jgi:2,3-bisphosphoglycerate-dependent phosphoglycerate mutase